MLQINENELIDNIHDPKWRLRNCYTIRTKQGSIQKFSLNRTQEKLDKSKSRFNMTLKGRQQGVSTYYLLKYLDKVLWNENVNVGILSHDQDSLEKLFRVPALAYKNMPEAIKPRIDKGGGSKYEMYFPEINSRIYVDLEIRSEALTALHVSEYGLMKDKNRFLGSIEAVDINYGEVSIESTPMGINHFYYDWTDSSFPYEKHFFPWYFHNENQIAGVTNIEPTQDELKLAEYAAKKYKIALTPAQIAWRRFKIKTAGSKDKFLQEHPEDDITCFLISGTPVLDRLHIKELEHKTKNGLKKKFKKWEWELFEKPIKGNRYIISADVAEGVGGDESAFSIIDMTKLEQVACFADQISPFDYADILKNASDFFSIDGEAPLLVIERNNHGHAVLLKCVNYLEGLNIYYHTDKRAGLPTDRVTRPLMIDTFIDSINNTTMRYYDKKLLEQCLHLVDNNGKIEASSGQMDDRVLSNALGLYVINRINIAPTPRIEIL